jgi:hypothetical protein
VITISEQELHEQVAEQWKKAKADYETACRMEGEVFHIPHKRAYWAEKAFGNLGKMRALEDLHFALLSRNIQPLE